MSQDERYRQLALFSVILAEVVLIPATLGGLVWLLLSGSPFRGIFTMIGALGGLTFAFYRIHLMMRKKNDGSEGK